MMSISFTKADLTPAPKISPNLKMPQLGSPQVGLEKDKSVIHVEPVDLVPSFKAPVAKVVDPKVVENKAFEQGIVVPDFAAPQEKKESPQVVENPFTAMGFFAKRKELS